MKFNALYMLLDGMTYKEVREIVGLSWFRFVLCKLHNWYFNRKNRG